MDQHYFLVCPVNSQKEEKLAGPGEACLCLLTNATYPRPGVDMQQFIRCEIATGIHCSTQHAEYHHCSTSRRGKEPSARFIVVRVVLLLEPHGGASVLLFLLIFDKVHIYSGEGRKTSAQHVMMILINHARIYLGLRVRPSTCSRSSSLSRNGGLAILSSIEIGLLTLRSHMSVICQEEVR